MKAIFNREFKSYFTSMIGPVFVAALVLVTGIYFMVYNMSYGYPYFAYTLSAAYVAIGMLISAMTESVIIAAVGTIITLLLINLSNGLSKYVPNTAIASLIGCLILLVLLCVIVYVMTKSNAATFGLLIGGAAVLIILYVVKPALFEGLVPGMIENIAFAKVMTSFVSDYVFDVKCVVELISICAACIFLTTQVIQKRRWS